MVYDFFSIHPFLRNLLRLSLGRKRIELQRDRRIRETRERVPKPIDLEFPNRVSLLYINVITLLGVRERAKFFVYQEIAALNRYNEFLSRSLLTQMLLLQSILALLMPKRPASAAEPEK